MMVLSTEWSQVEVIDLTNDGSGLGFGIVGGRSTGVVIKSILPGGIADKDARLQSGDHILQIGEVNLRGLAADQVASVLRQAGAQVRMVVARPVEPSSSDFQNFGSSAPIVPTKILNEGDAEELDRLLQQNGFTSSFYTAYTERGDSQDGDDQTQVPEHFCNKSQIPIAYGDILNATTGDDNNDAVIVNDTTTTSAAVIGNLNNNNSTATPTNGFSPANNGHDDDNSAAEHNSGRVVVVTAPVDVEITLPETERFTVSLNKDEFGLGITVAGYVCEREDLSGIFVKSLSEGSDAFVCGEININDRIVEVDGQSLQDFTNYEAVEKLKQTGSVVNLTLERYLRGPKYEQLREALATQDQQHHQQKDLSPPSPSVTTLSWIPIESADEQIEPEGESVTSVNSEIYEQPPPNPETKEIFIEEDFEVNLAEDLESATKKKWENIIGTETEIIVANLTKLKGLGISLEGTVDVECGVELRPHHYIRSILPEGPVGQNGRLSSGDELLEVNGQKLLGIRHVEVVKILRELPSTVRLVCARKNEENRVINTSQDREGFEARNILGGSLKNLLPQPEQRLLKALSDTSINTSSTVTMTDDGTTGSACGGNGGNGGAGGGSGGTPNGVLQKTKSRSLEVTNVAMWSDEVEYVDLVKSERGLGFSILDYQDPMDPKATLIVVRSLVPNGAAEHDGRITPGDRLISVNDRTIKNVTLDQAVQALKGTPSGVPVKLGISKPLPPCSRAETVSSHQTIAS